MSAQPRVSVVMPVYNAQPWLGEALESILGQTLRDFEIIVVDDGSSDGSAEIVRSYSDSRIRFIQQENQGAAVARNAAIGVARAKYLAYMDADDVAEPERLRLQATFLDAQSQVATVGCASHLVDDEGRPMFRRRVPIGAAYCRRRVFEGRFFCYLGTQMVRREAVVGVGLFRPFFRRRHDQDLLLRIAERYQIDNVPATLYRYRFHTAALSHSDPAAAFYYRDLAYELHRERLDKGSDRLQRGEGVAPWARAPREPPRAEDLRRVLFRLHLGEAELLGDCGRRWSALSHLARAFALDPFQRATVRHGWRLLAAKPSAGARCGPS